MNEIKRISYKYNNMPIHAGGYVTGFIFHSKEAGCMYVRTDIGGTYRYNVKHDVFESLIDHVSPENLQEAFPIALALDDKLANRLYIVCGMERNLHGMLCVSNDRGETFS